MSVMALLPVIKIWQRTHLLQAKQGLLFYRCAPLVIHKHSLNCSLLQSNIQRSTYRVRTDDDLLWLQV